MSEKVQNSLSSFMKKQITSKPHPSPAHKAASIASAKQTKNDAEAGENKDENKEEMTEEEELEEAKKESRNKAAEQDQTEMLKKLFMENLAKYALMITILAVLSIGIIKFGPGIASLVNGAIYKGMMGALQTK